MTRLQTAHLSLLTLVCTLTASAQRTTIPIEGIAARVNEQVVMVSDVMSMVRPVEARLRATLQGDALREELSNAFDNALNSLIERALILEEFKDMEGQIPEQAVDEHMSGIIAERFGNDRSELLKALQQEQISYNDWRQQVKDQLILSVMRREAVFDKVSISPSAAREIYEKNKDDYRTPEEIKLRMITVAKGTGKEEMVEKAATIKDARSRMTFGESFDAVARELSEDSKAKDGGDRGWIPITDLRKELANVATQLEIDTLSPVVSAGESYFLLLVEDRKPAIVVPFEEARTQIEEQLRRDEVRRIQDDWTARLREKHYIKIY